MKTLLLKKNFKYDGRQLRPLYAYMEHGLLGDSAVAWTGACSIPFKLMKDGEDLRDQAAIEGGNMLHFIVELFDRDLFSAVAVQRLMASMIKDLIEKESAVAVKAGADFFRSGDDLYLKKKKLSISIATRSPVSVMVHFAVNITNAGTPVPTCSLSEDFGIKNVKAFAEQVLEALKRETESMLEATRKVLPAT